MGESKPGLSTTMWRLLTVTHTRSDIEVVHSPIYFFSFIC